MPEADHPIRPWKAELLNDAIKKHHVRTFADLGSCWGVNAGYTFAAIDNNEIDKAYVVDQFVTNLARERGQRYSQVEFVSGIFNTPDFIHNFPNVDALVMYDIVLHQVDLDWNDFLTQWSKKARVLIIYNQMWSKTEHSIRFLDQGADYYRDWVYYTNLENLNRWLERLDEIDSATGRRLRDQHMYWQWGITQGDLISHVQSLGFALDFFKDYGPVSAGFDWIPNQGFVFVRN